MLFGLLLVSPAKSWDLNKNPLEAGHDDFTRKPKTMEDRPKNRQHPQGAQEAACTEYHN